MRTLLTLLLLCTTAGTAFAQARYDLTDLGPAITIGAITPGGARSVGSVSRTQRQAPAVFFRDGTQQVLAPDGRADGLFGDVVVGYAENNRVNQEAFVFHPWLGVMFFGLLPDGGFSAATGINRQLAIVGYGETTGLRIVPFVMQQGVRRLLPVPSGGDGFALAVSPQGRIVGEGDVSTNEFAAFHGMYWWAGRVDDMGTLGGDFSGALAVNDTPMAAGWSDSPSGRVAMTWTPTGGMVALPALAGFPFCRARALNATDVIVGACDPQGFAASHAVRWGRARRVVDLNTLVDAPGWLLEEASGINTAGGIAGIGRLNGISHAFLLTPMP